MAIKMGCCIVGLIVLKGISMEDGGASILFFSILASQKKDPGKYQYQ